MKKENSKLPFNIFISIFAFFIILSTALIIIFNHTHSYTSEVTSPTCTKEGYTTYSCIGCDYSYISDYTSALGHDLVHHEKIEASCTNEGNNEYYTCSRCDYSTKEIIPETGHDFAEVIISPTCTSNGYTKYLCKDCDYYYIEDETPALGHDLIHHEKKEATCNECGYYEYDSCSRCNYNTKEIIEAKGHTYIETKKEPTCTQKGYIDYVCSICNDSHRSEYIDATGHSFIESKIDSTCLNKGYTLYTCSTCGYSYKDNYIDTIDHEFSVETKEPTCTKKGYTIYRCINCGYLYLDNWKDALGHDLTLHSGKKSSCESNGYSDYYSCSRCSYNTFSVISSTGHEFNETYNYDSIYHYLTCKACGESSEKDGHDFPNEGIITSEPTSEKDGIIEYTCSVCGYTKKEPIAHNGHSLTFYNAVEASCTSEGNIAYYHCSNCNKYYKEDKTTEINKEDTILKALGHEYSEVVTPSTCTKEGYTTYTCIRNDHTYTSDSTSILSHDYVYVKDIEATCIKPNYKYYECSVCKDPKYEVYGSSLGHDYNGDTTFSKCNICSETNPIGLKMEKIFKEISYLYISIYDSDGNLAGMDYLNFPSGSRLILSDNTIVEDITKSDDGVTYIYNMSLDEYLEKKYYVDDTLADVVGYSVSFYNNECKDTIVNIPSTYNGLPVTTITYGNSSGGSDNTNMEKVIIPSSVKTISYSAFSHCTSLKEIVIPDSVTSLGETNDNNLGMVGSAFYCCTNLTKVTLSKNITVIPKETFSYCTSLKEIVIPEGVSEISVSAFNNCTSLESIVLPSTLKKISNYAFYNCPNITTIYYKGCSSDWDDISKGNNIFNKYNFQLDSKLYYYSEEKPTITGLYWHYDSNNNPVAW